MLPAPCSISPNPFSCSAVNCNANFTSAGDSFGFACSNCATAPDTTAAAMLEPDNIMYVPPFAPNTRCDG